MFTNSHISGKIIAATLFGVVLVGFAGWKLFSQKPQSDNGALQTATENILESTEYTADSDNDGVKDWEEILLGTDPNNPDTNNDGISDGDELAAARKTFEENAKNTHSNASTTRTDQLAREIFGAYIQSKQQGSFDSDSFDFIVAQAANSQFSIRHTAQYTLEDIGITSDTSQSRTLQYKSDFQEAITPVTQIGEYELITYGRAIESGNAEEFNKLTAAATIYDEIAQVLLTITAPEDAAQAHLDLINSFATFASILNTMTTTPEDPLLTFVATRDFLEGEDAIKLAYSQIDIYFTLKEEAL
ncbi:hypothetical protein JXR01_02700 [Candidatus Kaiserbacteria bacterium]|nr:MAG: hypothetical protein JXR01_02700 [Candidatus Kaiserbacteria bacterium]